MPTPEQVARLKKRIESVPRTIIKNPQYQDKPAKEPKVKLEGSKPDINADPLMMIDGVHFEVYKFFDASVSSEPKTITDKLKVINEWAFRGGADLSKAIKRIYSLDVKLAKNKVNQPRISKIYNFIRMEQLNAGRKA